MNLQKVSIIRNRGQLTIPEQIRRAAKWLASDSAVLVTMNKDDEVVIKPHKAKYDWKKIWEGVKKARGIRGHGTMNTAKFLEKDRLSH